VLVVILGAGVARAMSERKITTAVNFIQLNPPKNCASLAS